MFRPFNASEQLWGTINSSSSPIAVVGRLSGPLSLEDVQQALACARSQHPYLQASVDTIRKGVVQSALNELPVEAETIETFQDREKDRLEAVREVVRRELLKGIPIQDTLARAYLISESGDDQIHHLILMADHVAFDSRSLLAWLDSFFTFLKRPSKDDIDPTVQLELIDWQERIPKSCPNLDACPLQGHSIASDISPPANSSSSENVCMVEDTVLQICSDTFSRLKHSTKAHELSLNAPLFVAFACAVSDLALSRGDHLPVMAVGSCAVDVRGMVSPPLPHNFISSVAGTVNVGIEVESCLDLWRASSAVSQSLKEEIAKAEPFRLTQLLKNGDYAAIAPLFAVSFVWSNIGHYSGICEAEGVSLQQLESHVMGEGSNPLVSVHLLEVRDILSCSLTYSPKFHTQKSMSFLLSRFEKYVERLACEDPCKFNGEG